MRELKFRFWNEKRKRYDDPCLVVESGSLWVERWSFRLQVGKWRGNSRVDLCGVGGVLPHPRSCRDFQMTTKNKPQSREERAARKEAAEFYGFQDNGSSLKNALISQLAERLLRFSRQQCRVVEKEALQGGLREAARQTVCQRCYENIWRLVDEPNVALSKKKPAKRKGAAR